MIDQVDRSSDRFFEPTPENEIDQLATWNQATQSPKAELHNNCRTLQYVVAIQNPFRYDALRSGATLFHIRKSEVGLLLLKQPRLPATDGKIGNGFVT